jgi:hypothetical protein
MNYGKLKSELKEKIKQEVFLQNQLSLLRKESNQIRKQIEELENLAFIEWLPIDEPIVIKRFVRFTGTQINIPKTPKVNYGKLVTNIWSPAFSTDDIIQIIKKNPKSFVILCTKKKITTTIGKSEFLNPQSQFRINSEYFKNWILSDTDYKKKFETYITRMEAINSLLG